MIVILSGAEGSLRFLDKLGMTGLAHYPAGLAHYHAGLLHYHAGLLHYHAGLAHNLQWSRILAQKKRDPKVSLKNLY